MLIADLASEVIIHFSAFPGETFRVLKEKEERLFGEYRTRRLAEGGGVSEAGRMKAEG
jgi:hypothetical protein